MKTRILHCITSLHPDGAQRMLLRLVASMDRSQFENVVVSMTAEMSLAQQFQDAGIEVHTLALSGSWRSLYGILRFRKIIRSFKPTIVQGWMYHANLFVSFASMKSRFSGLVLWNIRRSLTDVHQDKFLTKLIVQLNSYFSSCPKKIIYCAADCASRHEKIGFKSEKRVVIGNGFLTQKFSPSIESYAYLRNEAGIPTDTLTVGIVGRYHHQKDFPNFIHAAALLAQGRENVHFIMIGRGVDSENKELISLIQKSGFADRFHLFGERSDVHRLMPGLDLYCSSSVNEGFPNVVGEAMCCGVPCVVTDVGGSREIVEGVGKIVPPVDPKKLAEAMEEMLKLSSPDRKDMGLKARERILNLYSLPHIISQYEDLYRSLENTEASKEPLQ